MTRLPTPRRFGQTVAASKQGFKIELPAVGHDLVTLSAHRLQAEQPQQARAPNLSASAPGSPEQQCGCCCSNMLSVAVGVVIGGVAVLVALYFTGSLLTVVR